MARPEPLGVWLDGVHIADLKPRRPWDLRCYYTREALDRWPGLTPLISCSLPLQRRPMDASVFASGLLPEGQHRQALAADLKVPANDTYSLLKRFGRDVAGALIISSEDPLPRRERVMPYTQSTLEKEVAELPNRPLAIHDDSELSLAGLQDKLVLVDLGNGSWGRPVNGRPSTHILKLDDRLRPGLVNAEAACLQLAYKIGLTSVVASVENIADISCLIVSRFDRRVEQNGSVSRVHQEDLCQALARDPDAARGRGKYQDAGGPSFAELAGLLDRYSSNPQKELDRLVAAITFTVVIGNADAHGKNLALLHPTVDSIEFAPLYDTVPTALWPKLRTKGAMAINGRWSLKSITPDDVATEAARWRHDPNRARSVTLETAERLRDAVDSIDSIPQVAEMVTNRVESFLRG